MDANAAQAGAVTPPDRRGDSKGLADDQERTGSENLSRLPNDPQPSQSRHEIHRPQHGAGPRPRGTRSIQRPRLLLGGPPTPPFGSRSPDRAWDASASPQCDSLYGGPRSSAQDLLSQSPALAQRPTPCAGVRNRPYPAPPRRPSASPGGDPASERPKHRGDPLLAGRAVPRSRGGSG